MNKSIEKKINQIYTKIYNKVFNGKNINNLSNGSRTDIETDLIRLSSSEKYREFAKKFAKELAKQGLASQRGVWRKYYQAARAAHVISLPPTYTQYEYEVMSKAVKNNFDMITSIPTKMLEILNHKYTSTLIEEVVKGNLPRGSFRNMLAKHGHKQANVIARTETAKLQTIITETRATNLGSVAYEWLASNDKRTRQSHKEMNGVIVFWNHMKPLRDNMRGHAGEFPNCRCAPLPIFDESDLTKSNYKVYNYKTDKIESIKKSDLLLALKEGQLK